MTPTSRGFFVQAAASLTGTIGLQPSECTCDPSAVRLRSTARSPVLKLAAFAVSEGCRRITRCVVLTHAVYGIGME